MSASLGTIATNGLDNVYKRNVESTYQLISTIYNQKYSGEWSIQNDKLAKGYVLISNTQDYIQELYEKTNYYITIYTNDTATVTNIPEKDGKKIEGTKINKKCSEKVFQGDVYLESIEIQGKDIMGYYVPIKDASENIIGIFFVGVDQIELTKAGHRIDLSVIILSIIQLLFWIPISIIIIVKMLGPIKVMNEQICKMANKDYRLDKKLIKLKAKYEIAEMLDSIKQMQSVIATMAGTVKNETTKVDVAINRNNNSLQAINEMKKTIAESANGSAEITSNINLVANSLGEVSKASEETKESSLQLKNFVVEYKYK